MTGVARHCCFGLAGACALLVPTSVGAVGAVSVRAIDAMTRVPHVAEAPASSPVELRACRGEWQPFQIIIRGAPADLKKVTLKAAALAGPEGSSIPAPEIYREHYVTVSRSTPMAPLPPGEFADALVPQSFAWPKLPEAELINQPYWIDVFVPYGVKSGTHEGSIKIITGSKTLHTESFKLHVWDFDLPVVPRLRTSVMTVWRRIAEVHGFDANKDSASPKLTALLNQYYELLARHRLSIDQTLPTYPAGDTGKLNETAVEMGMRKHLLHRHVSTIGLPIWPEWPFEDPLEKDRQAAMKYVATWMKLLGKIRCEARGYVIMGALDEPNSAEAYALVRRWGEFFNEVEAKQGVKVPLLVTEQPTPDDDWWGRLDGSVDIWVPHFSQVWQDLESPKGRRDIARRLAAGDEVWTYAALVQIPEEWEKAHGNPEVLTEGHPPVWALDYPPMNHRVITWLLPKHGITGLAYWDTLHASPGVDVWTDAGTFHHPNGEVYNGDGSYIYPATRKRHGVDAPVASMRLKWLREAVEDYDYRMLAQELGMEKEAQALTDTFARGFGDWEDDAGKLAEARRKLGDLIAEKGGAP